MKSKEGILVFLFMIFSIFIFSLSFALLEFIMRPSTSVAVIWQQAFAFIALTFLLLFYASVIIVILNYKYRCE